MVCCGNRLRKGDKIMLKKSLYTFVFATVMICLFAVQPKPTAKASNNSIKIKPGKTYYIDIDGNKGKEKIYVKKGKAKYEGCYYYYLYINDNKVKTTNAVSSFGVYCRIIDIEKNKKGKEIVFYGIVDSACIESGGIFKYKKGKLHTIGKLGGKYKYFDIGRMVNIKTNGKGIVTFLDADTPINVNINSYFTDIKLRFNKGKLHPVYTNELNNIWIYEKGHKRRYNYELSYDTVLYKDASATSEILKNISAGTSLKIYKIVYTGVYMQEYGSNAKNVYAYIKDQYGNQGWISIPEIDWSQDVNFFEEYPAWG